MPVEWIIEDICRRCCVWHKPGEKEEMACGGVLVIEALGRDIIPPAQHGAIETFENRFDEVLYELVCKRCPFRIDGCDFRDPDYSGDALPCGGYVHLDRLMIDGNIEETDIRRIIRKVNGE